MKRFPGLLILPVLMILSCGTQTETVSPEEQKVMIHEPSGTVIPVENGIWVFTRSQKFREDGWDMAWNFEPKKFFQALVTMYVYPAGNEMTAEEWEEHYDACKAAMTGRFRNCEILEDNRAWRGDNPSHYPEGKTVIRYSANGMSFISILYLTTVKGWHLKYRITVDEPAWEEYQEHVERLIGDTNLPQIPIDSL